MANLAAMTNKKLFIKTWGCQMNVYDSQKMADVLAALGYTPTASADTADLILLNTCHIREKATEKLFSDLGRLRAHKEERGALIAVAGCVAQAESDVIASRAPYVDMIVGPQAYHHLPEMVLQATQGQRVINTDFPADSKFDQLPGESANPGPSAFLSVQEGCDKFCSFCVVPYTRGAEYSRPPAKVLEEARRLADAGAREITLLGQNVNAYHGEDWSLARLIAAVAEITGIERIRYMTSHPNDMDDDLIAAHRDIPQLMPFLHLPVQSGSDRILSLMNRKHTAAQYLEIVDKMRIARPDVAFSSDFIVGFPGETEDDHQATLDLARRVGYASCYSFKYSPRPGTPGAVMAGIVPEAIKDRRLQELQALLFAQARDYNAQSVGKTVPVLFDRKGQKPGQLLGKTPHLQSVYATAPPRLFGHTVDVHIDSATQNGLAGSIALTEAA